MTIELKSDCIMEPTRPRVVGIGPRAGRLQKEANYNAPWRTFSSTAR